MKIFEGDIKKYLFLGDCYFKGGLYRERDWSFRDKLRGVVG